MRNILARSSQYEDFELLEGGKMPQGQFPAKFTSLPALLSHQTFLCIPPTRIVEFYSGATPSNKHRKNCSIRRSSGQNIKRSIQVQRQYQAKGSNT
jgi:hypothetical protein